MNLNFAMLGNRVLIRPDVPRQETAGGVIIPETKWQPEFTGTAVAVGPEALDVRLNDRIVFGLNSGQELYVAQQKYLIMRETDVLAICEVIA